MDCGYSVGVGAGVELSNGRPSSVAVMAFETWLLKRKVKIICESMTQFNFIDWYFILFLYLIFLLDLLSAKRICLG